MEASKYNMTEDELFSYCDSLSVPELKKFQLDDKLDDIKNAENAVKFFVISLIACISTIFWSIKNESTVVLIIASILGVLSTAFIIGYSQRKRYEEKLYRFLLAFFEYNNI